MRAYFTEEMKEDYDTMGPEAAIQTAGNNGTGKGLRRTGVAFLRSPVELAALEGTKQFLSCFPLNSWETFPEFS